MRAGYGACCALLRKLFRPSRRRENSVFDIDGFRFDLFAYRKKRERHRFGTNCLPSVEVESLEVLKSKTHGLKVRFPLTKIGKNRATEIEYAEGNRIEVTAPADLVGDNGLSAFL